MDTYGSDPGEPNVARVCDYRLRAGSRSASSPMVMPAIWDLEFLT
jgi:hypothetical protein